MKIQFFQSWLDDGNSVKDLPLAAKGLFWEMERWAVRGKPYGHVTWPNGDVMTIPSMATATGESSDQIAEQIKHLQRVDVIGLSKSGGYVMRHLVRREELRKKRKKSGSKGGEVTLGSKKKKRSLLKQMPDQTLKPISDKPIDKNKYWFEGRTIKLDQGDYLSMLETYGGTDEQFMAWLQNRDEWISDQPPERRTNWFISTQRAAGNVSREA